MTTNTAKSNRKPPGRDRIDFAEIKKRAVGRGVEVLEAAGIPARLLDGRNHPCPKCGGTDRFAAFKDVNDRGAVHCRSCFSTEGGDILSTVAHYRAKSLPEAARWINDYLGDSVAPSKPLPIPAPAAKSKVTKDFAKLHEQNRMAMTPAKWEDLEQLLGLPVDVLRRQRVGWDASQQVFTWPMADDKGKVIGLRTRDPRTGSKKSITGSSSGLFVPHDLPLRVEQLFVTESPTDCAAVLGLGLWCIGRADANSNGPIDYAVASVKRLQAKTVIVIADNDPNGAGKEGAEKAAKAIQSVCESVVIIEPPAEHKDIRDWVAAGATKADIDAKVETAITSGSGDKYEPFPTELLPRSIERLVVEQAEATDADHSMFALPMLATLAACVGTTRQVQAKAGWTAASVIWGCTVARSGTMKSVGYDVAHSFLSKAEAKQHEDRESLTEQYEQEMLVYDRDVANWKRQSGKDKSAFVEPPTKPRRPQGTRFVVDDSTLEGLVPILQENPRGLFQLTDELKGFFDGMGAYAAKGNGGKDEARWLAVFDARSFTVDRKTDRQVYHVPKAAISVYGTIQPRVLESVATRERLASGMMARLLVVMPPTKAKKWSESEVCQGTMDAVQVVIDRLRNLEHLVTEDGEQVPGTLLLSPEAKQRFARFVDQHGQETHSRGDELAAVWSKLEGYALRFALVDHLTRWAEGDPSRSDTGPIPLDSIERGIDLARWFGKEAERVYGALGIFEKQPVEDCHAARLAEWLEVNGGRATERSIKRGMRRYRGDDHALNQDTSALVDSGLAVWDSQPKTRYLVLVDHVAAEQEAEQAAEQAAEQTYGVTVI